MNHKYLNELLDYHYWAQERVFEAVEPLSLEQFTRDLGNSFPSVRDTLSRLDGKDHRSLFWQMFHHVINHGTYHRGQVTMMLRQLGAQPVGTDLIQFYWRLEQQV